MITPFTSDGKVDISASKKIVNYLIEAEVAPFLQGTTGEGLSIPNEQRLRFVEAMVKECSGRSPVYAAISHHSFGDAVALGRRFLETGVEAVAAHLPAFYPMSDFQIIHYYEELADALRGPLLLYNIPKTVHRSIPLEVADKLSRHPNICGIKDSENNIFRQETGISQWKERDDFVHLIGCAAQSAHALSQGSAGIVPSAGNIVPHLYQELYEAALAGNMRRANQLQKETDDLSDIWQEGKSLTESLAALKVIMKHFGFCEKYVLPPLTECEGEEAREIQSMVSSNKHLDTLRQQIELNIQNG